MFEPIVLSTVLSTPQRLYFKEGEPGKDGTEAGQTVKTEKGRTKNEKKRFTPLDDFFFSWDWSVLRRFSCSSLFRLSLS
jgi:hypothetical protein